MNYRSITFSSIVLLVSGCSEKTDPTTLQDVESKPVVFAQKETPPDKNTELLDSSISAVEDTDEAELEYVIYDFEETIEMSDFKLSSPDGFMISDQDKDLIGGDLKIETPFGTLVTKGAVVEKFDDRIEITVDSIKAENLDESKRRKAPKRN